MLSSPASGSRRLMAGPGVGREEPTTAPGKKKC